MGEDLLDFTDAADLTAWLAAHRGRGYPDQRPLAAQPPNATPYKAAAMRGFAQRFIEQGNEQGRERGLAPGVRRGEARILRSLPRLRFWELPDTLHNASTPPMPIPCYAGPLGYSPHRPWRRCLTMESLSEGCGTGPGRALARQPRAPAPHLASADLAVLIPPTPNQGRATTGDALTHQVTTTSRKRVRPTRSHGEGPGLAAIRRLIGTAVGLT